MSLFWVMLWLGKFKPLMHFIYQKISEYFFIFRGTFLGKNVIVIINYILMSKGDFLEVLEDLVNDNSSN